MDLGQEIGAFPVNIFDYDDLFDFLAFLFLGQDSLKG
jgi:hypothetical protein